MKKLKPKHVRQKTFTLKPCEFFTRGLNWKKNFPPVLAHTSVAFIKRHRYYDAAKTGDLGLAVKLVQTCVKYKRTQTLKRLYPKAVLLPIWSANMLPLAYALNIGLPVYLGVGVKYTGFRKQMSGMERLVNAPRFYGEICKGQDYILVDDIVTQGGTLSALRRHVILKGGNVVAVTALSYAPGSHVLAIEKKTLKKLSRKFRFKLTRFLRDYSIVKKPKYLTNAQAIYLLRFSNVDIMRREAAKTRYYFYQSRISAYRRQRIDNCLTPVLPRHNTC